MRKLRAFRILLLFLALFSAIVYAVFGGLISDLIQNLRTGGGDTRFQMAVRGGDGNIYALGAAAGVRGRAGGYSLVGMDGSGRRFVRNLPGLPEIFTASELFVSQAGDVLISLYEQADHGLYFALYVSKNGARFEELLRIECEDGNTQSVMLSSMSGGAGAAFFLKNGDKYDRYAYDPDSETGLLLEGPFLLSGEYAAGIVVNDTPYAAADGKLFEIGDLGADELRPGGIVTKLYPAEEGFWYLDAGTGRLKLFDLPEDSGARGVNLLQGLPCAPEDVSFISVSGDEILLIEKGQRLYSLVDGVALEWTGLLYRPAWEAGALLAAFAAAILILTYACWYLLREVRKLYFPIVLRNALRLGLISAAVAYAALRFIIAPAMTNSAGSAIQTALLAAAQTADADLSAAARDAAVLNAALAGTEFIRLSMESGEWRVVSSSSRYEAGFIARTPGALGYLIPGVERGERYAEFIETPSEKLFAAFVPIGANSALAAVISASAVLARSEWEIWRVSMYMYSSALVVTLFALIALASATRGVRRVTKGVDVLSLGRYDVSIVQNSGDELTALANSFNALADSLNKSFTASTRRGESYLQFLPQRLVSLLGARSVEEIGKSTTASRDMAMMVVWLGFPEHVYQSDPEVLFENINEVIGSTSGVVSKNGGTIYNFNYHGYDAVFSSELEAISTAVEIRQEILALNDERLARGSEAVTLRIALDKGNMMMGVVGDDNRMVPTVVSACLNRARTLIELAGKLDAYILCSLTIAKAAGDYALRYIGKTRLEGERVYEIFDGDPYSVRAGKETAWEQFSDALYQLYSGDFAAAKRGFMDIVIRHHGDGTARYYLYVADQYEKEAPEAIGLDI